MERHRKVPTGVNLTYVGVGRSKLKRVKEKFLNQNQGGIRQLRATNRHTWALYNQCKTSHRWRMQQPLYSRSGISPHCWKGMSSRRLTKAIINISLFHHFMKIILPLLCYAISLCKFVCILCSIISYFFHHSNILSWRHF